MTLRPSFFFLSPTFHLLAFSLLQLPLLPSFAQFSCLVGFPFLRVSQSHSLWDPLEWSLLNYSTSPVWNSLSANPPPMDLELLPIVALYSTKHSSAV